MTEVLTVGLDIYSQINRYLQVNFSSSDFLAITGSLIGALIMLSVYIAQDTKSPFDRSVIFAKVLITNNLVRAFILLTFPLLFWRIVPLFAVLLYLVGLYILFLIFRRLYMWIRIDEIKNDKNGERQANSFRDLSRLQFLREMKNFDESIIIWEYLWKNPGSRERFREDNLIKLFLIFNETYISCQFNDEVENYVKRFRLKGVRKDILNASHNNIWTVFDFYFRIYQNELRKEKVSERIEATLDFLLEKIWEEQKQLKNNDVDTRNRWDERGKLSFLPLKTYIDSNIEESKKFYERFRKQLDKFDLDQMMSSFEESTRKWSEKETIDKLGDTLDRQW